VSIQLSEYTSNVIENVACRAAQACGGSITPHHVIPHLPISLGIVEHCLSNMVDGASITSSVVDGFTTYSFAAYREEAPDTAPSPLSFDTCVACDTDFPGTSKRAVCHACSSRMQTELNTLAEQMGWPTQAVYEHEILYNASEAEKPLHPAQLAASSRFTLRSMRRKLDLLAKNRFARKEDRPAEGVTTYAFPPVPYPRDHYKANMDVILTYPASIMEEVQDKFTRILLTLSLMLLLVLGLAFWGIPFPMLILLFAVSAPITAIFIWRHKRAANDD
jgi:hypothetical protein